jgi:inosine-uridine nucleoside N-ribohydrolase
MVRYIAVFVVAIVATASVTLRQSRDEPNDPLPDTENSQSAASESTRSLTVDVDPLVQRPVPRSDGNGNLYIASARSDELLGKARCGTPPERLTSLKDGPVPVIFDTDFGPDVDDVGALAILHVMADQGEAEILGVMISTSGDSDSPRAVDVVNTYYGRPDIPIGLAEPSAPSFPSKYVEQLGASFESEEVPNPTATSLYRQLLAEQPDRSVTIVSVGFKSNLDDLLLSQPDDFSPLNGADLVARKVKLWVAMAGQFPNSEQNPVGAEFNLVRDLRASIITMSVWPTPVVFSGFEVGSAIWTGSALQTSVPEDNPVREAYRLYNGGTDKESWDLTAVWYAVRGSGGFFETCPGRIDVKADGSNEWDPDASGHAYLRMTVDADLIANALDALLVTPPAARKVLRGLTVERTGSTD